MTTDLTALVARQVFLASLMERLLHDPGPWVMETPLQAVPASVALGENSVIVRGVFPEPVGCPRVSLTCNGRLVQVLDVDPDAIEVTWELSTLTIAA